MSHIVAYGEANTFLTSKVKGEGQGHVKGQNNIFGHNFCFIWHTDFQLISYCTLWKGQKFLTSKVKVKGQGHIKGQNKFFYPNFCSICRTDFQLVSYCSLWKGQ